MGKKFSLGATISLAAITAAITVSLTYVYAMNNFNDKMADVNQRQAMYTKLGEIDQKARQDYIGKIDEATLNDAICAGYVAGLADPNGKYLSAEKYQSYLKGNSSKSIGVGIQTIQDSEGNMEIVEVFPNSAAELSGLKKGDTIIAIDGKEVIRLSYGAAVSLLDGQSGSSALFSILRSSAEEENLSEKLEITVLRSEYQRNSLSSSVINGNVLYIKISDFQEDTAEQFEEVLREVKEKKTAGLVIDLRNNSGGSEETMSKILDELLPAGNMISSVDKDGKTTVEYTSDSKSLNLPISVVINQGTYGIAEIFAADIKDYKKGMLVGSKTAGFGTKNEVLPLSDGSAVMISVAKYVRVGGESYDGLGILPEIELGLNEEQKVLFDKRSLSVENDPQIQAAVTALFRQGAQVEIMPGTDASKTQQENGTVSAPSVSSSVVSSQSSASSEIVSSAP